ncbi:unnamed protein product, partial [marine sediment metagenome]
MIGEFCVIEDRGSIGDGRLIRSHTVIYSGT